MELAKSQLVLLRRTLPADLDYVIRLEREASRNRYVEAWPRSRHEEALDGGDGLHVIVESTQARERIGFILLGAVRDAGGSVELQRIVIGPKGKGFGRSAIRLVKKYVFEDLHAHRLWLDVKDFNQRARGLYRSEGFVEEGTLRECVKADDGYESLVVMSMLESEYDPARVFPACEVDSRTLSA